MIDKPFFVYIDINTSCTVTERHHSATAVRGHGHSQNNGGGLSREGHFPSVKVLLRRRTLDGVGSSLGPGSGGLPRRAARPRQLSRGVGRSSRSVLSPAETKALRRRKVVGTLSDVAAVLLREITKPGISAVSPRETAARYRGWCAQGGSKRRLKTLRKPSLKETAIDG